MRGLTGKGVLVTGAARGIGYATAERFGAEGARVFLCDTDAGGLAKAAEALSVPTAVCDVSDPTAVGDMVAAADAELGGIDVLVNNAGIATEEPFLEIGVADWDAVMSVNLRGAFLVAQAVSRRMVGRGGGGVILNMSATNGLVGEAGYAHYNASKAGILALTRTMALELGAHRIRVNAVCPGYLVTPMSQEIDDPEFVAAYVREKIPLGRTGTVEDVTGVFCFLASDDAGFIHGEGIVVDGGQLAQ